MKDTDIHSYHIFMFPFSLHHEWTEKVIEKVLLGKGWNRKQFDYKTEDFASNFSEMSYFYEFSSGAMFDDPDSLNRVMATYALPMGENAYYTINVNKNGDKSTYKLHLDKIELNIYDDKAAILSFHLANTDYTDFQDILNINDFGRRIYPQFLANDQLGQINLQTTKNSFLADSIEVDLDNGHSYVDDFSSYSTSRIPPFALPKFIKGLLPKEMHECKWLLDDRMYVVSYYCNDEFTSRMTGKIFDPSNMIIDEVIKDWYRYVFVDNDANPTCQDEQMFKMLLSQATYSRWTKYYGTTFGVSRYSFVCSLNEDGTFILRHIKTMYYRMASLVLAQRALSLYYSREISEISKDLDDKKTLTKELRKRVDGLNRDYLRFVNNIYFREVTPQDQGIELYDLLQKQMNIKRDEEGLGSEVEQLYHYVSMTNDAKRSEEAEKLTWIATLFLIPTLITGIWGMNVVEGNEWLWVHITVALGVLSLYFIAKKLINKHK